MKIINTLKNAPKLELFIAGMTIGIAMDSFLPLYFMIFVSVSITGFFIYKMFGSKVETSNN